MLDPVLATYSEKTKGDLYTGHISGPDFYCILEIPSVYPQEEGDSLLRSIYEVVVSKKPGDLEAFDQIISSLIQKTNLPIDFSLAAGYRSDSILYLKTIGTGQIYVKKENHFEQIIEGDTNASGYITEHDLFVLTTSYFMENEKGKKRILDILHHKKTPSDIVAGLSNKLGHEKERGAVSLFVSFEPHEDKEEKQEKVVIKKESLVRDFPTKALYILKSDKKKRILLVGIIVVFLILLFNTGNMFGKKQRVVNEIKVDSVRQKIEDQLKSIDVSDDVSRSLGVISEVKASLEELKKTNKTKPSDLQELEKLIDEYESKVLKREEKTAEEFYDLTVEEKDAKGDRVYLFGEFLSILNKEGRIYVLSLESKSFEKKIYGEIANAQLIASFENTVFFYRQGAGIYKIDKENKPKRVIEDDTSWGNIIDMNIYNGNIYLLDKGKDEIYKYLVAENGYSDKNSYVLSGSSTDFSKANSFAIDSSVYVGFDNFILKYMAGEKQDFTAQFPDTAVSTTKIFTNRDSDQIYALDKAEGILYIFAKDGTYVKQIKSKQLTEVDDFVVYKEAAYLLHKSKIKKINL